MKRWKKNKYWQLLVWPKFQNNCYSFLAFKRCLFSFNEEKSLWKTRHSENKLTRTPCFTSPDSNFPSSFTWSLQQLFLLYYSRRAGRKFHRTKPCFQDTQRLTLLGSICNTVKPNAFFYVCSLLSGTRAAEISLFKLLLLKKQHSTSQAGATRALLPLTLPSTLFICLSTSSIAYHNLSLQPLLRTNDMQHLMKALLLFQTPPNFNLILLITKKLLGFPISAGKTHVKTGSFLYMCWRRAWYWKNRGKNRASNYNDTQ